jgi:hypothetical protein
MPVDSLQKQEGGSCAWGAAVHGRLRLVSVDPMVGPDDVVERGISDASRIPHAEPEGPAARRATEDQQTDPGGFQHQSH